MIRSAALTFGPNKIFILANAIGERGMSIYSAFGGTLSAITSDGPPTLERSGSERRGGAVSSLFPEGERVGVRGGAFLKGKEGRVGFRKNYSFAKEETEQFESAYPPITP